MTITIDEAGDAVRIILGGKLSKADYEHFVPRIEARITEQGPIRLVVVMQDFHGWTPAAMWEDTKFAGRHWRDIERVAMIGDHAWEHGMALFCAPFTRAKLKYFDVSEAAAADDWIGDSGG